MPNIKTCFNSKCEYNRGDCYCNAGDVEIDADGSCFTFEEKDIYKNVEGFGREAVDR